MKTYDQFIYNSTQYLHARGLPSNTYSMNGTYVLALAKYFRFFLNVK